jgi:hypothetical protein
LAYSAGIGASPLQIAESTGENAIFGGVTGGVLGAAGGWLGSLGETAAFGQSYATSEEWASLLASRYGAENVAGGTVAAENIAAPNTIVRYVGPIESQIAQDTGFIPNVDRFGNPKTVFVTPEDVLTSPEQVESAYQIGAQNPLGPTSPPTHIIIGNPDGVIFDYGGNVEGVTGIELTTQQQIPVISIRPIGGQ